MNVDEAACKSTVWRKGEGELACSLGVGHWAEHTDRKGHYWSTREADCEHRWDWLRVCGGHGAVGSVEMRCDNCETYFDFDIRDRRSPASRSKETREHFNEAARKKHLREKVKA